MRFASGSEVVALGFKAQTRVFLRRSPGRGDGADDPRGRPAASDVADWDTLRRISGLGSAWYWPARRLGYCSPPTVPSLNIRVMRYGRLHHAPRFRKRREPGRSPDFCRRPRPSQARWRRNRPVSAADDIPFEGAASRRRTRLLGPVEMMVQRIFGAKRSLLDGFPARMPPIWTGSVRRDHCRRTGLSQRRSVHQVQAFRHRPISGALSLPTYRRRPRASSVSVSRRTHAGAPRLFAELIVLRRLVQV